MEKITAINPARILWSMKERGMDVPQLVEDADISEQTLVRALNDNAGLTFNQLQRLAKLFNRGVLFFMEPGDPVFDQYYSPQFRTLANQKPQLTPKVKAVIERAERQREVYLSLREDLGEPVENEFNPPDLRAYPAGRAGEAVRRWLGLAERNNFESYRAAVEAKGILVFRTNGYNGAWQIPKDDDIDGFCIYDAKCPMIVVKKQAAEARQTFTLFHELAHLLLHRESFIDGSEDIYAQTGKEKEANEFAGRLLVPDAVLPFVFAQPKPADASDYDDWLRSCRAAWGVSSEVILRRLLDEGRLAERDYAAYRAWKQDQVTTPGDGGSREYRYREPVHIFGPTFTRTVLDALAKRRITTNKASGYLDNLTLEALRKLEKHLAAS